MSGHHHDAHDEFRAARDSLLRHGHDLAAARSAYRPPRPEQFNWARDWFDAVAHAEPTASRVALWIVDDAGDTVVTYSELSRRTSQLADWLATLGVGRGDRVMVMLDNQVELWETFLACMKLGAVVVPASTMHTPDDVRERVRRASVDVLVTRATNSTALDAAVGCMRISVGGTADGCIDFAESTAHPGSIDHAADTLASDTLLLYFTSGTVAEPKIVEHTHASYPIGHLSTMYWIGVEPGDIHLNVSSPGWAKHAWSSMFAPWNAEATVVALAQPRFDPISLLDTLERCEVTTLCAPPTVWRMLVQHDLAARRPRLSLREAVSAGEPLNPAIIESVEKSWGITVRNGYGQTETTAQLGCTRGSSARPGSMGRPLPGFDVDVLDGELRVLLDSSPVGMMRGYVADAGRTNRVMRDGAYHSGDIAVADPDGSFDFVGRNDDVFKSSGYRISPFELESVLIEHPWVAEAAVVPAPDEIRHAIPKAFVVLAPGVRPSAEVARSILEHGRSRLAPFKRVRVVEFADLPKTISGKIRRAELRSRGVESSDQRGEWEFREHDFDWSDGEAR